MSGFVSKIKLFIKNPEYFITSPAAKGYLDWMPDAMYLKLLYRAKMKKKCNLRKPVLYNEKLQWLKLHDRKAEYSRMVDKWEVRAFITEKIGKEYLIPDYGVYEKCEDIDVDSLPNAFVIKCTHDSGSVEICTDKTKWNRDKAFENIKVALRRNYYKSYREWPYKAVKPRIIIEKYMHDEVTDDLKDYKVMCFNGRAEVIELHENRFKGEDSHTQTFYSREWEKLDIEQPGFVISEQTAMRPVFLDKMLELSEELAKNMYHIRVDWYEVNGKLFFGEITFYDGSGFATFTDKKYEKHFGDLIVLD